LVYYQALFSACLEPNDRGTLKQLRDFSIIRSGISMRCSALVAASLAAAALVVAFAAPAAAAILVNIDKDTQSMTVTVDGAPRYIWPVSTGRAGYDTPNGTFKPNRMDADHLSQEWDNAPMPHTIFFDLHGHAIHGFNDTRRMGSPASHGCVRLAPQNAATLFALVEAQGMKDTMVVISGQTPTGPQVARRGGTPIDPAGQPIEIAPGNPQFAQPPAPDQQAVPYGQPAPTLFGQPLFGGPQQPAAAAPQQQRTGFFGQPPQPPPYGQQPDGQQSGYVRSSNGQLYYVQPGAQQPNYRQY
jgi:hypothetical protein